MTPPEDDPKPETLKRVEGQSSNSVRATVHAVGISYSGPLPPPSVLREFEATLPGSAERIFSEFEKQSAHRRQSERKVVDSNAFAQKVGALSASLIGVLGVGGGIWLTDHGKSVSGLATLFGVLGSIVGTFFYQRRSQDVDRSETRRKFPSK